MTTRVLIGGDWNEPATSEGAYSPAWIAKQTGLRIHTPAATGPGHDRIDYVMTDAPLFDVQRYATGGSDHPFVTFRITGPDDVLLGGIWNCEFSRNPDEVASYLATMMVKHDLDFVLLQEARDYHQALANISNTQLIAFNQDPGDDQQVIVVASRVLVTSAHSLRQTAGGWGLRRGRTHAPLYATGCLLDGWLAVIDTHEASAVDWRGRGPLARMVGTAAKVLARRQSAKRLVKLVRRVRRRARHKEKP